MRFELFRMLKRDREGAAVVEFALAAIPIFLLLFGTLQNILMATARVSLDAALQNMAYDAANASLPSFPNLLTQAALCDRPAFYFVDCNSSPALCFSVESFDAANAPGKLPSACVSGPAAIDPNACCFRLSVQYDIPFEFDLLAQIQSLDGNSAPAHKITAVAYFYRA